MNFRHNIVAGPLLTLLLLCSACAGRRPDLPYDAGRFDQPNAITALPVTAVQRLGPQDLVAVTVFRAPEVSGEQRVDDGGNVTIPLIGRVAAGGLTPDELARSIQSRLGARYYVRPNVTVLLKEAPLQRITVDGSVGSPGIYPIVGPMTLVQAVALAKGTTEDANVHRAVVFRTINGQRMAAAFDLDAIRSGQADDPPIYRSDVVVVDGNRTRRALRDILQSIPLLALFRPF